MLFLHAGQVKKLGKLYGGRVVLDRSRESGELDIEKEYLPNDVAMYSQDGRELVSRHEYMYV